MTETEVDKYSLDCKNKHLSLKVCLLDYEKILLELTNKQGPEMYKAILSTDELCDLCYVFYSSESINDSLDLIKKTIESGKIALEEKTKESKIELEMNISLDSVDYPSFIINLLLVNNGSQGNSKGNYQAYNYQADKDMGKQNENTDYDTTEVSSIVQSKVKNDAMELEYIQPILQLHYPDGTVKNTPLTPTLQGANGKTPNMTEEQIKNIKEMINRDNNRGKLAPIRDNFKRSNSSAALRADYPTKTMPQFRKRNLKFNENIYETKTIENDISQDNIELNMSQDNIHLNRSQTFGLVNEESLLQTPNPTLLINNFSEPSINYQELNDLSNAAPVTVPVQAPVTIPFQAPVAIPVQAPVTIPFQAPISIPVQVPVQVSTPVQLEAPVQVPYVGSNVFRGNIYSTASVPVYQNVYAYNQNPSPMPFQSIYQPAVNYIQESQYLPQTQINMGYQQAIYPTNISPALTQNSMFYPKKYYFPKLKK